MEKPSVWQLWLFAAASALQLRCATAEPIEVPATGMPLYLRERLMEGRTALLPDPDYEQRPFRGLVRRRVGVDGYGRTVDGTYLASLYDDAEPSVFDARRAWLLRGKIALHIPALKVLAGDRLAFYLGALGTVLPRGRLRPACSLDIEVKDEAGGDRQHHALSLGEGLESSWTQKNVDLAGFAGRSVSVDIRLRGVWCSSDDHVLLGDLQLFSTHDPAQDAARARETPGAAPSRPNVLVIWIDKLRADLARPDTGIPGHMPFLHELTQKGVLFTQARSNSNNTFRSTVQTLLSDPNSEALAGENFTSGLPAPLGIPSLPGVLADAGYYTAGLGANIHLTRIPDGAGQSQVDVGFDRYSIDYRVIRTDNDDARMNREQVAPWLETELREPFFVNLHYDGPHEPFPNVNRKKLPPNFETYLKRGQGDPRAARYLYKAELFDPVLQNTFELLEAKGLLERTLVVIASDHGTTLGPDHRFFKFGSSTELRVAHAGGLYDEQVRVLLMFLHPSLQPARRSENVQLLDLAPTVLDFLGIPAPTQFSGRSLLPALSGGAPLEDQPIFFAREAEYMYGLWDPPYKYIHWLKPQERWAIDPAFVPGWGSNKVDSLDRARFVQQIEALRKKGMGIGEPELVTSELFNLDEDPRELNNLVVSQPEVARSFQARLDKFMLSQRIPEWALDEARESIAFVSPGRALYEGTIESDGPLKLSSPLGACDPYRATRRDLNTIEFQCGASSALAGLSFYRRAAAELRFAIRRDGVPVAERDFFLGADGLPSSRLSARDGSVVLPAAGQPPISARSPELIAERDRGVFLFRQPHSDRLDDGVGQSQLNQAFAAWGYRQ